ncbi:FecR protein [Anaerohalosphaera lusitana]|uniref:FecR protein n=1 Tax=Anaerohalosphaera lusitana TaxID=1936003 RepID=A0A1U9NLN1_9BACT|nr:NPCBM/NEW2 domain-containing protein [Anaerohalosphaera lusitana]AQT68480.1 FecR protein [Anaerohalosphaera lusitana]
MLSNDQNYKELGGVILKVLSGSASKDELAQLRSTLEHDPYAMQYYCEYVSLYSSLRQPGNVSFEAPKQEVRVDESTLGYVWDELAEAEQMAETVPTRRRRWFRLPKRKRKEKAAPEIRSVGKYKKLQRKFSKAAIYTAVTSAAAMLLVMAHVIIREQQGPIVATVTEAMHSKWSGEQSDHQVGDNLRTLRKTLLEGFARLEFKSGADVIIQGPAEIEPETENQLMLYSGSLFSYVPDEATGFVVRTPNATVIDYGTEFGVTSHPSGLTEVHVFEGEVEIRAGDDPVLHGSTQKLYAGQAGIVDANGVVKRIELADGGKRFAKAIPNDSFAVSGSRFDLADVVAGGNGFGSGEIGVGIDPVSGEFVSEFKGSTNRTTSGEYKQIPENPYVDGLFVPDGGEGPQQITSEHSCDKLPDTTGWYWSEVTTDPEIAIGYTAESKRYPVKLNGVEYGGAQKPAIVMHANLGITFDLENIRMLLPGQELSAFRAKCGISEPDWGGGNAGFRVMVDGEERFALDDVKTADGAHEIDIPLESGAKYLTLITVDGGEENGNGKDWTVFAEPYLELKATGIENNPAAKKGWKSRFSGLFSE